MKSIKKVLLIFIMIISIFGITNVKALGKDIKVTGASVKDKSGTITVIDPVLTDNVVTSNITFNKVGDFVTFEFEIKNNESEKYKIESIKDNNTNDNIKIEYSFSKEYISSGNTGKVTVKLSYKNKLVNQEKINLNNLAINMTLLNEEGNSSETIINNPATGDSILHYLVLLIISVTGLIFILKKKRYKGLKVGSVLLLIAIIMVPFVVLAQEKYEINLKFNDIEVKGEFEKYNITINPENGSKPITREVTYGQPIGDLPDVSKEGYDFDKWVDGKENKVTKETIITGPIEIEAKYNVIKYDIVYNLNGGKLSTGKTNPSKYTIENDAITLNNPSKDGYTFTGWTGTGIDTKTTSVTIEAGSTGNREYTANYSANENTPYKVIHRYKNLNETYTEEEVTEYGETDKEIDAPIKSKKGFVNPSVQEVTVKADGTSKVTYTYEREKYNFSISDRTYIDNSSTDDGKYPYETEIKVKAIERDGYDFAWSDGKTELERTFKIDENTTLTPVYTAKTNIPYKVVHQKQKITLDGYEIADTQNLKGTTDSEITPAVNTYEGFTSPQAQKVTIKGDGSTVVTYNYDRIMYNFSTNNNEDVISSIEDGRYPYGTEITLTAKEKQGYTFSKWSNNETTNPLTITLDSDLTIEPVYTSDGYTVTFNSNGGGNVNSITVDAGETIQSFTTPTAPSGKIFDGWYTDLESGSKVNTPYTPEGNITLYAHWNNNSFPEVFSEPGECTFNGSNGVLTGDNCSYANGTNKYIDTGINLYNSENHDKDYEIGFTIVSYNPSEQVKQATFMNTKLEGNNYPGLVFRRRDNYDNLDFSSRKTSSTNERKFLDYTDGMKVKIYRITNEETGIQEIFYSINDEEKIKINDLSQFNPEFDLSVWFGAAPTNASATAAQRILVNTTLKDMYIKLGTYQESSNTETYKVTYNANGGSVSPTSKTINIGDQIGTLPTPTPPTNKTFDGWYTELTGGVKVTSSYIPNNNITIYARYINDISGATISPSSISIINGNNQTITVSNVEEEYTFTSNNTSIATVDSTGKVTGTGVGTTTITITGSTSGKTRTINVKVEPSSYTVTLNANGGSVNPTLITVNNGDSVGTLPEPTPPTNKTFDGWYTDLTGGVKVTSSYVPNNNITLYARYKNPTYTISFDAGEGSAVNDIEVEQGNSIGTLPTSTRNGYILEGWYEENTYETKVTSSTIPTGNVTYYAKWEELKVCADNENITRLSENTCSNNENITVGDGIVCKRAVKLHEETCSQTDGTYYCSGAGYIESGSKGTSTITYGSCGTSGTLSSGDAFTCDVNGDEKFDELTERFYYVSDYYDTSAKEFDDSTAVLIYYNNVTSGVSCNKNTFAYDSSNENWHGPRTLASQLPTTSQWSNVSLKSDTRAILGEYQSTHDSLTTTGGTLPTDFSYEGYAARLLTVKELMAGCNLTEVGRYTTGELDSCNYVMENTKYAKSSIGSYGPWLETPRADGSYYVWHVRGGGRYVNGSDAYDASFDGARPVIEVPKRKIEYGASSAYTVTLNANGGSVNPTSITVNIGDAIGTLPTPTAPTGKSFTGWYTDLTGGIEVTSTYIPNTDIEIYARYNSTYTVSFDTDGGSTVASQTVNHGGVATRPTTDPTKTGYTFDDWYTDDTYTTKFDFDTPITSETTIYAYFEELKVCADNENITRLSENTCSNNENITIGDGIVCKRAVKLHEETCSQTDTSAYCSGAGYIESGSKGTSTITYGSCGTSGTLSSGDAFTCDINGDEKFDELTERFYYISDYYDTSAKEFDDSTAVLIYYNDVTSGVSCNKNTFAYDSANTNYNGPRTLVSQLPTTSQWSNVELKNTKRQILTETGTTSTSGGTLPKFDYSGYAARFITAQELNSACGITIGNYTTGELDSCNYVMENTKYAKSSIESYGGWLETPRASTLNGVWNVNGGSRHVYRIGANNASHYGARPAIEVLKSKISY